MWKWCYFNYNLLTSIMTWLKKKKLKRNPITWLDLTWGSNWYFNAWVHITWQLKLLHFVLLNSIDLINLDLLKFIFYNRIYLFVFILFYLFISKFDSWRMRGEFFIFLQDSFNLQYTLDKCYLSSNPDIYWQKKIY